MSENAEVVWFFGDVFVPDLVQGSDFSIHPLSVADASLLATAQSYFAAIGQEADLVSWTPPTARAIAITLPVPDAAEADLIRTTWPRADAIATAVGYRQYGKGRALGVLIKRANGEVTVRPGIPIIRQITNFPFVPEADEIANLVGAFSDLPSAKLWASMFADACRESNPSFGIARLWTILEALAENFDGSKREMVDQALTALEIGNPIESGDSLTVRAYRVRNIVVHEAHVPDDEEAVTRLRSELVELTWFALRRAGFQPVPPPARDQTEEVS